MKNWAGNFEFSAKRVHRPTSVDEVRQVVSKAEKARALGTRHSFSLIADTPFDLISVEHLTAIEPVDREQSTVAIEAGVSYGQLAPILDRQGFALHNLASLPHISVVGACATSTHGSGEKNKSLSAAVRAMEIVTAEGDLVTLSRNVDGDRFLGAVVGLGGLGVVTRVTLDVQPAFTMRQQLYERLPFSDLEQHFDEVEDAGYSVSLFTDWKTDSINQVWVKQRDMGDIPPALFGATLAQVDRHPIGDLSPVNCTKQMGVPGPWYERLPHFRMAFTPSSGEELQSEFYVPRAQALDALREVQKLSSRITPVLQISEIRAIAADDFWMSPSYRRDSIGIHFTWEKDWAGVSALLPDLQEALRPFRARPHWSKLFTMSPQPLYERLSDFHALLQSYDPKGKFRNPFLDQFVF
ncbi:MAG TPA: FAD-binding protein [Fimbriimonas sp.]|nr:FAD-binding protein [Fimbriimonas sp.]